MRFNITSRAKAWKQHVDQSLWRLADGIARIDALLKDAGTLPIADEGDVFGQGEDGPRPLGQHIARLHEAVKDLERNIEHMQLTITAEIEAVAADREWRDTVERHVFENAVIKPLWQRLGDAMALGPDYEVLLSVRGRDLIGLFLAPGEANRLGLAGADGREVVERVAEGEITAGFVLTPGSDGRRKAHRADSFLAGFEAMPLQALVWSGQRAPEQAQLAPVAEDGGSAASPQPYFARLQEILDDIDCIDFYALGTKSEPNAPLRNVPFNLAHALPRFAPAEPRRRSLVLLHNNYYHFNCLAAGLRKRGWDAVTVSLESLDSPQRQFYHGEDVNLFDADPEAMARRTADFFRTVPERFENLHFCGQGYPTFFHANVENSPSPHATPWDFLELRRHRTLIGFMPSGCTDGGLQSSIQELTGGLCDRCVWQLRPDVCSDERSLAWNRKLALLCDWVGLECDHATPERVSPKTVYGPVVTTLDPDRWHPDIDVPDEMRIERQANEILIYHAVGNYLTRRVDDRDLKGTGAVFAAIEQLKAEGLPVRLVFAHDVPSTQVRFLQVQADIVVDQLNYGRYGANAREAMMLGRPTICRMSARQAPTLPPLRPIEEAPMEDADESSVVNVMRALVLDRDRRLDLGRRARQFAVAWHGQDACAERYERVVDRIRAGLPPDSNDLYPV